MWMSLVSQIRKIVSWGSSKTDGICKWNGSDDRICPSRCKLLPGKQGVAEWSRININTCWNGHLRRCSDSHYVTFWQLEDCSVSALEISLFWLFFFQRGAVSGEEEVEETHAAGNELVNTKLQLLLAMRFAGPTNFRGFIITAVFLSSLATFSQSAQRKL